MEDDSGTTWDQIEREKKELLGEIVDRFSEEEYEIFREVLKLQSDHRHMTRPHGMREKTRKIIERVIQ